MGPVWLEDITRKAGIDFQHDCGSPGTYFMPQIVGSGVAFLDFDGDGRLDIYLVQNGGPKSRSLNRLLQQQKDGTFRDVTAGSGLGVAGYGMGTAVGDVNNDGRPDVLVTEYGRIRLFVNRGQGNFRDVTGEAGLENPGWGTSASFVDYDRDGWLDLVVVNYVGYSESNPCTDAAGKREYCGPNAFPGTASRLFHNRGPQGKRTGIRFEDVTARSGIGGRPGPGLGVFCADFNGDQWPDLLIANDGKPNHLWINQHNGTFKEEALARGIGVNQMGGAEANMGIAAGDVDGDGLFDIFVTHLSEETNTLWKQGPPGIFQDRTVAQGLSQPHWRGTGFGTLLADLDLDGSLDLAIANGHVRHSRTPTISAEAMANLGPFWSRYADRNQLFVNDGQGHFTDISEANAPFCGDWQIGRGLACGDIDNDGALDLLVTNCGGPARLYRNVAPRKGHWLMVQALEPKYGGRDACGAEIRVHAGSKVWLRQTNPGYSYLCSNDPRAHVGLGDCDRIDSIDVTWPDGSAETFAGGPVDCIRVLRHGEGQPSTREGAGKK